MGKLDRLDELAKYFGNISRRFVDEGNRNVLSVRGQSRPHSRIAGRWIGRRVTPTRIFGRMISRTAEENGMEVFWHPLKFIADYAVRGVSLARAIPRRAFILPRISFFAGTFFQTPLAASLLPLLSRRASSAF